MAKHTHVAQKDDSILETSLAKAEEVKLAIEDMPLETLRDYRLYNEEARKLNKKLRICRYPIKQCPIDLHPKQRISFSHNNKSANPLPVFLSNHLVHYDELWTPGKEYDVPECVVHHVSEKANPIWGWVTLPDGSKETQVLRKDYRFSIRTISTEQ